MLFFVFCSRYSCPEAPVRRPFAKHLIAPNDITSRVSFLINYKNVETITISGAELMLAIRSQNLIKWLIYTHGNKLGNTRNNVTTNFELYITIFVKNMKTVGSAKIR